MKFFKLPLLFALILSLSFQSNAQMVIGDLVIGQGVSGTNWQDYFGQGIFIDVNTSACGFQTTPHYLVTLETGSSRWQISGVPSIYSPTPTGFRVYLRWTDSPGDSPTLGTNNDPNPLTPITATNYGWVIRWTAISTGPCSQCGAAPRPFRITESEPNLDQTIQPELDLTENLQATDKAVKVFPNPTQTMLTVQTAEKMLSCEVYDVNGKLLIKSISNEINVEQLGSGNYYLKIYFENGSVTRQFSKT